MKRTSAFRFLNLLLSLCLIVPLFPSASADEAADSPTDVEAEDEYAYTLDGKTWDELIEEFINKYSPDGDQISLGYYNTVTGETHFYLPDKYFIGASLYKLPLCMFFQQAINIGAYTEEDFIYNYKLGELIRGSIVESNNDYAHALLKTFKEPRGYRLSIAEYVGVNTKTIEFDSPYWSNTYFNARQIISCLRYLYEDPDDFQIIMDYMGQAEPHKYFNYHEQSVPVAHKYGYVTEFKSYFINDCGICYTEDPILIVIFTRDVRQYTDALPDYCTLMIDYSNASREQRLENEAREEAERLTEDERLAEQARLEAEAKAKAEAEKEEAEKTAEPLSKYDISTPRRKAAILVLTVTAGVLLIIQIIRLFRPRQKRRHPDSR